MRRLIWTAAVALALVASTTAQITVPYSFTAGTVIDPDQMNSNFTAVAGACNRAGCVMTGSLKAIAGTAGLPGISNSTDATTGEQIGTTGTIGWSLSGTQRMLLNASGLTVFANNIINSAGKIPAVSTTYFGTLPSIDATSFASLSGANLTTLNASNLSSGTVGTARLGSGSAISTTFLRGDSTWAVPAGNPVIQTTTVTGNQNNFALTAGATLLRVNNATLTTFTGFAAGFDGQRIDVVSIGAGQVDFTHASGSSTTPFTNFATSGTSSLAAGSGTTSFVYDATTTRWRMVEFEQGAWISPTFAAGDFTSNGAQTWTLTAPDVVAYRYRLSGRTMTVSYYLQTTTVGGTPNTALQVKIPGGFTSTGTFVVVGTSGDNSATFVPAYVQNNGTVIQHFKSILGTGNWAAATDTTYAAATIAFEVT